MEKVFKLLVIGLGLIIFTSCAFHGGNINNSASLSQANFSYVHMGISGGASTKKFLGIGGFDREAIVAEAKKDMLRNYPLKSNQALVNITISWKDGYIFFVKNKCTVTADVVEFYAEGAPRNTAPSIIIHEKDTIGSAIEKANTIENTNTNESTNYKYKFKVGDMVEYVGGVRPIIGEVIKTENGYYFIKYTNKRGVEKIKKTYYEEWIKKIE